MSVKSNTNENMKDLTPNCGSNNNRNDDELMSKLLRRLLSEDSISGWVDLCKKLDVAVHIPTNTAYISRSFDKLLTYVLAAFKKCPSTCFKQFCSLVGLMAYIGRSSFSVYEEFIRKTYKTNKRIQKELALALKATLIYDTGNLTLESYSESIIRLLKEFMENVDNGDIFIIITSATVTFSKNYPYSFKHHFADVLDVVIRWHIESKEPKYVRKHCAYVLVEFAPFIWNELCCTLGLLAEFNDDVAALSEKVEHQYPMDHELMMKMVVEETMDLPFQVKCAFKRMGRFIGAFNSLFKSLLLSPNFTFTPPSEAIVGEALRIGTKILLRLLTTKEVKFDAVNNINELYSLCLLNNYQLLSTSLENIVQMELKQIMIFNEEQKLVILYLTLCYVQRQRSKLTTEFVKLIFSPEQLDCIELQMYLTSLKLKINERGYKLIIRIYEEILLINNVPLKKQACLSLTHDINNCIDVVISGEILNI